MSEDRASKVAMMARIGLTNKQIAWALSISVRTVNRDRVSKGVADMARTRRLTDEEIDRALALLQDGCSYHEVARTIGCEHSSLRSRFPGYGIGVASGHLIRGICA